MSAPTTAAVVGAYDAWCVAGGEVEPMGSHHSFEAAVAAASAFDGGCVTAGLTFLAYATDTDDDAKALLRAALGPHGVRAPKPWSDMP